MSSPRLSVAKYKPLADHLRTQPGQRTTLTFDKIDDMLGGGLPASVYSHHAWWATKLTAATSTPAPGPTPDGT